MDEDADIPLAIDRPDPDVTMLACDPVCTEAEEPSLLPLEAWLPNWLLVGFGMWFKLGMLFDSTCCLLAAIA